MLRLQEDCILALQQVAPHGSDGDGAINYTLEWEEEETEARNCCPGPELGWPPGCFEHRGPREGGTGKGRLEPGVEADPACRLCCGVCIIPRAPQQ